MATKYLLCRPRCEPEHTGGSTRRGQNAAKTLQIILNVNKSQRRSRQKQTTVILKTEKSSSRTLESKALPRRCSNLLNTTQSSNTPYTHAGPGGSTRRGTTQTWRASTPRRTRSTWRCAAGSAAVRSGQTPQPSDCVLRRLKAGEIV